MKKESLTDANFSALLKKLAECQIPISLGLKLLATFKAIETERSTLIKSRNALIRRHGKPDGNGGFAIAPEDAESVRAFKRDFAALLQQPFEPPFTGMRAPRLLQRSGDEAIFDAPERALLAPFLEFAE